MMCGQEGCFVLNIYGITGQPASPNPAGHNTVNMITAYLDFSQALYLILRDIVITLLIYS